MRHDRPASYAISVNLQPAQASPPRAVGPGQLLAAVGGAIPGLRIRYRKSGGRMALPVVISPADRDGFLAGRVAGVVRDVERHFGVLFDSLLRVGCPSADWRSWRPAHAESWVPALVEQLVERETFAPLHGEVGFDLDLREPTAQ